MHCGMHWKATMFAKQSLFQVTKIQTVEGKVASTNLTYLSFQTLDSFVFTYFYSNVLYYMHLFCMLSNVLYSF